MATRYTVEPSVHTHGFHVLESTDGISQRVEWFPDELRAHHEANDRNRALSLREAHARNNPEEPSSEAIKPKPRDISAAFERIVSDVAYDIGTCSMLPEFRGQLADYESREAVLVYAGQGLRIIADRLGHVRASFPEVEPLSSTGEEVPRDVPVSSS